MTSDAQMLHADSLIIGAGPTGLTLGIALLLQGRNVLVIDKHHTGLPYSRAILINGETMQALGQLGVVDALRNAGQPIDGLEVHIDGALRCSLHVDAGASSGPLLLPQLATEQILRERFLQLGGVLQRGYNFENSNSSVGASPGIVDLLPVDTPQPALRVQYQWLFGCDGMHSAVREALGLGWHGRNQAEQGHAIDATLHHWSCSTNAALYATASGIALVLRIGPRTVRIAGTTAAQCHAVLQHLPIDRITWESSFSIQFMTADSYGRGHTWLAGDATHVHSPIGGRGMNMGIADALALARAVQQQDMGSYVAQRKPVAARWVRINYWTSRLLIGSGKLPRLLRWTLRRWVRVILALGGHRLLQSLFVRIIRADQTR